MVNNNIDLNTIFFIIYFSTFLFGMCILTPIRNNIDYTNNSYTLHNLYDSNIISNNSLNITKENFEDNILNLNNFNNYIYLSLSISFYSIIFNIFRMVVVLICVCVLNYFYLFKICYLTSVNIIYGGVSNYFIVFNKLFGYSLDFIKQCIENSYTYSYNILELIITPPNNYLIFIYLMLRLYYQNQNQQNRLNQQN